MRHIECISSNEPLESAPIPPNWIDEGKPYARNRVISHSSDRSAWTMLWDCTAGQFNWHYTVDEIVYLLEGSVTVTDNEGLSRKLKAGDVALFRAGTTAQWHVETYVRKLAVCQHQLPMWLGVVLRLTRRLARVLTRIKNHTPELLDLWQKDATQPASLKLNRTNLGLTRVQK